MNETYLSPSYFDYSYDIYEDLREKVYPEPYEWFILALFAVILLLALGGNTLVCYAVLRNEHMRTVTNYYIVNLSVADILVSLVCLVPTAMVDVTETWWFGELGCKLIPYFQHVTSCVSIYTLTAIAVDRYLAICHPLKFRIRASRTIFIMVAIWVWSVIIILPQAYFLKVTHSQEVIHLPDVPDVWFSKCYERSHSANAQAAWQNYNYSSQTNSTLPDSGDLEHWHHSKWQQMYHVSLGFLTYIFPLCVIGVAYAMVCIRLWSAIPTEETRRKPVTVANSTCDGNSVTSVSKLNFARNGRTSEGSVTKSPPIKTGTETQVQSRRKVARMLIVVVIIFAVCFLPLNVMNLMRYFGHFDKTYYHNNHKLVTTPFLFAHLLVYINSAVNPIIYNFLSAKFRREFRMAFSSCKCTRRDRRRHDSTGITGTTTASMTASRRAHRPPATGRATSNEYVPMSKVITRSNRPQSSSSDF